MTQTISPQRKIPKWAWYFVTVPVMIAILVRIVLMIDLGGDTEAPSKARTEKPWNVPWYKEAFGLGTRHSYQPKASYEWEKMYREIGYATNPMKYWEAGLPVQSTRVILKPEDSGKEVALHADRWVEIEIPHEFSSRGKGHAQFLGVPRKEWTVRVMRNGAIIHAEAHKPVSGLSGTIFRFRAWTPGQKLRVEFFPSGS